MGKHPLVFGLAYWTLLDVVAWILIDLILNLTHMNLDPVTWICTLNLTGRIFLLGKRTIGSAHDAAAVVAVVMSIVQQRSLYSAG